MEGSGAGEEKEAREKRRRGKTRGAEMGFPSPRAGAGLLPTPLLSSLGQLGGCLVSARALAAGVQSPRPRLGKPRESENLRANSGVL